MKYLSILGVILLLFTASSVPVFAQGSAVDADDFLKVQGKEQDAQAVAASSSTNDVEDSELEKSLAKAKAELEDKEILAKKIALAKAMHKIRPTRDQVDAAVTRASMALPEYERRSFIDAMSMVLNYNAIERISIDAMIETYTLEELDSMVEYFSKPEAVSASKKIGSWSKIVQPEIARMIDKAIMRVRIGR